MFNCFKYVHLAVVVCRGHCNKASGPVQQSIASQVASNNRNVSSLTVAVRSPRGSKAELPLKPAGRSFLASAWLLVVCQPSVACRLITFVPHLQLHVPVASHDRLPTVFWGEIVEETARLPYDLPLTNCILGDPICKCGHFPRYWGLNPRVLFCFVCFLVGGAI